MSGTLDFEASLVSSSASEDGENPHLSSSQESLPVRTYTTVRVSELSRLHTTIANLQADERRREALIAEMAAKIQRQEAEIERLKLLESMFCGMVVLGFGLGLGAGVWVKVKSE